MKMTKKYSNHWRLLPRRAQGIAVYHLDPCIDRPRFSLCLNRHSQHRFAELPGRPGPDSSSVGARRRLQEQTQTQTPAQTQTRAQTRTLMQTQTPMQTQTRAQTQTQTRAQTQAPMQTQAPLQRLHH